MNFIKRNLALILLIIPSIIIISAFAYVFAKRDDITFYLKDIRGDKSALSDITIAGVLQDQYHGQHFEIKNGEVNHHFEYYDKTSDALEPAVNYVNGISSGDLVYNFQNNYKITPDADTKVTSTESTTYGDLQNGDYSIEERTIVSNKVEFIAEIRVRHKDWEKNIDKNHFSIHTGVVLEGDGFEYEFTETVEKQPDGTEHILYRGSSINTLAINNNNLGKCMALLEGKLYFTIPTTKECYGENGIFVVDEYEYWWEADVEGREIGKGRKIVRLNLDEHNIDVMGLEAVNEQLVLIMMIDNILTLRTYDKEGNFIDEISFEDIDMQTTGTTNIYPMNYEAFINGNILNLSLNKSSYGSSQAKALISVEIGDEIKEKHKIHDLDFNNEITQHYNIYAKDDKLYIVTSVQNPNENNKSQYDVLRPRHFIIMVYENSDLLYKGELVTDADEDLEIERLKNHTGGFGYNMLDYRHFEGIELR